jgi:hypothetical protein
MVSTVRRDFPIAEEAKAARRGKRMVVVALRGSRFAPKRHIRGM